MSSELVVRTISTIPEVRSLIPEWIELWKQCPSATPFQRPEWLVSWAEIFTPQSVCMVEARRNGKLVGLAPMFVYTRNGERVLAPLGAGITDYLDWLIDPAEPECIQEIAYELTRTPAWDVMELMDLPRRSLLLLDDLIGRSREACDVCPAIRFAPGTPFQTVVPRHQRRNLKTAQNRIARTGRWKVELANRDTLPEFVDTLFRLHQGRWRELGHPGVLADAKVRDFHGTAAPRLLDSNLLRFFGLRYEGKLIGLLYALAGQDAIYCYLQGFNTAYAEFSPGMLLLEAVVRAAIEEGKAGVDFLRGKEAYKYTWGAQDEPTYKANIPRPALVRDTSHPQAA